MGPLRRRLIALFLFPNPVLAEVCDKTSPDWTGTPLTIWTEATGFWLAWPGLILLALTLMALWAAQRWFLVTMAATLALTIAALTLLRDGPMFAAMQAEGCAGPQGLKFASLVLLSAVLLWRAKA